MRTGKDDLCERVRTIEEQTRYLPAALRPRVAFVEWIDPIFSGGHWNPTLVALAGGVDVLGAAGLPSRTLPWQQVVESKPDVLFIACCGFGIEQTLEDVPLLRQLPGWRDLPCVRDGRVYVADGNAYFSRPGPRLVESLEMLAFALHPDLFPELKGVHLIHRVQRYS